MDTKYKENYIRLGLKIAYYRKLRGMTQEQFAEAIGKSWSFIALVESPSKAAVDISHILGNLITVIFDYQILRKPLKILSL